ncbi:hypothetical protein [Brevibacterium sp. JSBI002]|uniref:hypothetical protein n=1 Tax=Brevibacterium sp. JSBI002 TaxID=2886045 RepID=UPI0022328556|nr:hypothetical protein [Brevibacterium sp. JSBI002]UZD62153.1 hypothetical protein LJ362_16080 [Brevibacterium sp. JSBI002]
MSPETVSAIVGATLIVWGAFTAWRAHRATTRIGLLSGMVSAAVFVLLIRLITPFGSWHDWFVWVWLAAMLAIIVGAWRAALVWPDLPWRAEDATTRRTEASRLGFEALLALICAGALVLPGFLL